MEDNIGYAGYISKRWLIHLKGCTTDDEKKKKQQYGSDTTDKDLVRLLNIFLVSVLARFSGLVHRTPFYAGFCKATD